MLKTITVLTFAATVALAQGPPQEKGKGGGKGGGAPVGMIQQIKPGFYMIPGAGANSEVRVTNEGVILVDGKLPGEKNYDDLMAQIKSVTSQPVKYLLITHHHQDHTGNNDKFLAAGVQVVAHENVAKNLVTYAATPKPATPNVTYTKDHVVKLGGVEADMHYYGRAHTSGDSIVYFPDLKIVVMSDTVTNPNAPNVDLAGGGSWVESRKVVDGILKLDFDTAIPGNGNPMTRAEVEAFKTKLDTVVSRAIDAVKKGTPKDQLVSAIKTDDIGWRLNLAGDRLDLFYDEVSKAAK
jgi:cyclase